VHQLLRAIVEPGFFSSSPVQVAAVIGAIVALVSGGVGVFTVIRGQAFAGEALGDLGAAGGSSAYLVGIAPLWGFMGVAVAAAGVMELIGIQRARGRDLATGIVLGAGFGLAALFLYLGTTYHSTTGATITILFGSIFALSPTMIPSVVAFAVIALGVVVVLYRPLLLSSVSPELAAARGIPTRLVGGLYLFVMAVAVALSALTIGAILSTALLVGPAATALRLSARPGRAILTAALVGIASMWLGILLAYDSYYWPPHRHGWPVSFFVVTLILVAYLLAGRLSARGGIRPMHGQRTRAPASASGAPLPDVGA
jgi:zinc/manganese transport system permease protein